MSLLHLGEVLIYLPDDDPTPIRTEKRTCAYCAEPVYRSPCPCKPPTLEQAKKDNDAKEYDSWLVP